MGHAVSRLSPAQDCPEMAWGAEKGFLLALCNATICFIPPNPTQKKISIVEFRRKKE